MSDIFFKTANLQDLDDLIEMRVKFSKDLHPTDDENLLGELRKATEDYLKEKIVNKKYIGILGYHENRAICTAGIVINENLPIIGQNKRLIGTILNFYTEPSYRKKGHGTQMMEFIKRVAKEEKITKLILNATADGEPVYRKSGFHENKYKELILEID